MAKRANDYGIQSLKDYVATEVTWTDSRPCWEASRDHHHPSEQGPPGLGCGQRVTIRTAPKEKESGGPTLGPGHL